MFCAFLFIQTGNFGTKLEYMHCFTETSLYARCSICHQLYRTLLLEYFQFYAYSLHLQY